MSLHVQYSFSIYIFRYTDVLKLYNMTPHVQYSVSIHVRYTDVLKLYHMSLHVHYPTVMSSDHIQQPSVSQCCVTAMYHEINIS
jgi:hypothetical protein